MAPCANPLGIPMPSIRVPHSTAARPLLLPWIDHRIRRLIVACVALLLCSASPAFAAYVPCGHQGTAGTTVLSPQTFTNASDAQAKCLQQIGDGVNDMWDGDS